MVSLHVLMHIKITSKENTKHFQVVKGKLITVVREELRSNLKFTEFY